MDENDEPEVFQLRLRGPRIEGLPQDDGSGSSETFVGTALFSFEGPDIGLRPFARIRCERRRSIESPRTLKTA